MKKTIFFCIIFLFFNKGFTLVIGNPSDPDLYFNGLTSSYKKNFSFRASYLYNNIYKGRFQDKFKTIESTPSDIKLKLLAAILTFNLFNRLDLYSILGTTNLQLDQLIYTDRRFAWSTGFKALLLKIKRFDFSFDGKYFATTQKPQYFVVDKDVYPLADSFEQKLEEYQASFSMSYKTNLLIPYIGSTFLYSTITPDPKIGYMTLPGGGQLLFETSESITRRKWGMVLGISVVNFKNQANLNIETRMFDQNAFAFIGTFRF
jgi:hypothetical protein